MRHAIAIGIILLHAPPAMAAAPEIVAAVAEAGANGWTFAVTIAHPDTGWDHYADAWEVVTEDGARLGLRELAHPHETEQPFTRSLSGVAVPEGAGHVLIRARCNVDGWGAEVFRVDLPR